jgi:hypothetical protein
LLDLLFSVMWKIMHLWIGEFVWSLYLKLYTVGSVFMKIKDEMIALIFYNT